MKYILFLLLALTPTCFAAPLYENYTLKNGLQVLILPNARAPVVYHALWYKVGSADSPAENAGIAHFLEHLMFKGTKKYPKDAYKTTLNRIGAYHGATTTWDRTVYYATASKEHLPLLMELEADRMQHLQFTDQDVETERQVVFQERYDRIISSPIARLGEAANASFFWQHPYGKPVLGFEEHIKGYTKEKAQEFYKSWYATNNAILVIAGDVNNDEVKKLIEKYYGSSQQKPIPKRERPQEPSHQGVSIKAELKDPNVGIYIQRIYRAPNHRDLKPTEEAAITMLDYILGNPTYGRLPLVMMEQQKLVQGVWTNYTGYYVDPYSFTITVIPKNLQDIALTEAMVESELRRIKVQGITEEELENIKRLMRYEFIYHKDSLYGIADYYGENLALGYTLEFLDKWPEVLSKVSVDDIQKAATALFANQPDVTMYSYPIVEK